MYVLNGGAKDYNYTGIHVPKTEVQNTEMTHLMDEMSMLYELRCCKTFHVFLLWWTLGPLDREHLSLSPGGRIEVEAVGDRQFTSLPCYTAPQVFNPNSSCTPKRASIGWLMWADSSRGVTEREVLEQEIATWLSHTHFVHREWERNEYQRLWFFSHLQNDRRERTNGRGSDGSCLYLSFTCILFVWVCMCIERWEEKLESVSKCVEETICLLQIYTDSYLQKGR